MGIFNKLVFSAQGSVLSFLLAGDFPGVLASRVASDSNVEIQLESEEKEINKIVLSPGQEPARIKALADQYGAPEGRVKEMLAEKMDWGEITISLATARQIILEYTTPLTIDQTLDKVLQLREDQKMTWRKMADELGFKLAPVANEVHRSKRTMKQAEKLAGQPAEKQNQPPAGPADEERLEIPDSIKSTGRAEHTNDLNPY